MKTITYEKKSYSIPTSWDDITIEQQIKAEELSKEIKDDLGYIGYISAYTDLPISLIKKGDVKSINEINKELLWLQEGYAPNKIEWFELQGKKFYLKDLIKTEFQDYLSTQIILKNNEDFLIKALPRLIAVYCKQEGETLDDYDLDEREKFFYDLPLSTAKDIESHFFFSNKRIKESYSIIWKGYNRKIPIYQSSIINEYNKKMEKAQWQVFAYEICDWNISDLFKLYKKETGQVLQFAAIKKVHDKFKEDLEQAYADYYKKKNR